MASEILGLFGGKSSQQLRGDALDSLLVSPAQMGSQSLLQQVVSMGQNAGSMIGMGAGQLLGGKVAGEVEAAYIDEAIKNASKVSGTPAQKMKAVADFLADKPGMGSQYMKAMEEARKLELTDLQTQKARQDLQPEFKNVKVPVDTLEMGADGKMYPVRKSIELTYKWDKEKNAYVPFQGDAQGTPKPSGDTSGPPSMAEQAKAQLAKEAAAKAAATGGAGGEKTGEASSPQFTGRAGMAGIGEAQRQQRAAEAQAKQETDYETERLLRRSTPSFKTVAEKEEALRAAVKAGNYGLASQISKSPPFRNFR